MAIMNDGFSTTIAFADDSSVQFKEKEISPPGLGGGGEIDITTMQNTTWRTKAPKTLKQLDAMSLVVSYDPAVYDEIISMLNSNQLITITFPDTSTLAFYGWIDSFVPNRHVEGEQPTAEVSIMPSLVHSSTSAETAPSYTAP